MGQTLKKKKRMAPEEDEEPRMMIIVDNLQTLTEIYRNLSSGQSSLGIITVLGQALQDTVSERALKRPDDEVDQISVKQMADWLRLIADILKYVRIQRLQEILQKYKLLYFKFMFNEVHHLISIGKISHYYREYICQTYEIRWKEEEMICDLQKAVEIECDILLKRHLCFWERLAPRDIIKLDDTLQHLHAEYMVAFRLGLMPQPQPPETVDSAVWKKLGLHVTVDQLLSKCIEPVCPVCRDEQISRDANFAIFDCCCHLVCVLCAEMISSMDYSLEHGMRCPLCRALVSSWTTKYFLDEYRSW